MLSGRLERYKMAPECTRYSKSGLVIQKLIVRNPKDSKLVDEKQ